MVSPGSFLCGFGRRVVDRLVMPCGAVWAPAMGGCSTGEGEKFVMELVGQRPLALMHHGDQFQRGGEWLVIMVGPMRAAPIQRR